EDAANGNRKGITVNAYNDNGATLTSITVGTAVEPSAVIDFENDEVGTTYSGIAWSPDNISVVVAANPSGTGKALHVTSTDWNSYAKFPVTLPNGLTLSGIEKIAFDIYFSETTQEDGDRQHYYKNVHCFFGATGASFTANEPTIDAGQIIAGENVLTWIHKDFALGALAAEIGALSAFDLGLGVGCPEADYYLDNIRLIAKESGVTTVSAEKPRVYSSSEGIYVAGNNEKVSIFAIDGRLVRQAVANNQLIPVNKGVYVVKTGNQTAKALVR
ncbi:MAG: T9SS type A sorting domain-containing protein, partial [Candidatus Symbiothrix sp.]|nr:T9SS type A sorting domain-containing protein [Candidatus Symbiothrix sp.]